jgi:hypothetical protein
MKNSGKASMNLAPIVLFVYNRAECTLKTLEHLKQNVLADQSALFIYSDGPKPDAKEDDINKIQAVREIISKEKWCGAVHIIESPINLGLANSVIKGVTEVVTKFGKVIVLEDDLLTSIHFLEYLNEGLNRYENKENVFVIAGYNYPIKVNEKNSANFSRVTSCLGWGTWERAWDYFEKSPEDYRELMNNKALKYEFDLGNSYPFSNMFILQMENNIDSWAIRWWWSIFKNKGLTLFPNTTLLSHIGFDENATHTKEVIKDFNKYFDQGNVIKVYPDNYVENPRIYYKQRKYLRHIQKRTLNHWLLRVLRKVTKISNNGFNIPFN